MMNSIKAIAPFVFVAGALLVGPVLTMTMFPEKLGDSYVFGAIDGMLVTFATAWLSVALQTIWKPRDED